MTFRTTCLHCYDVTDNKTCFDWPEDYMIDMLIIKKRYVFICPTMGKCAYILHIIYPDQK